MRNSNSILLCLSACALTMVSGAACAKGTAQVDSARIAAADAEPGNWMSSGRSYDEQRYSPLDRINDGNVASLGLAWTYKLDIDRAAEATPVVVDGVMYTTGAFSFVYALDARSGRLLWKYDPKVPRAKAANACCDVGNRGVAVRKGKVYVGAFDGRLIALDARSGKKIWETDTVPDHSRSYSITGAPLIVKDKVLIGNGGAEYGVRGYISAFDADTGKLAWRFYTVPGDPAKPQENAALEMARKTWSGDKYFAEGGGGTVWNAVAYDPALNLVYFGTGNGVEWNRVARGESKEATNLFLASIVAVNADTGEYAWHYQEVPGDMWDYDADESLILADLSIGGKPRKVLLQAPKNGFFYVLDRATGELLSAEKFAPATWASAVDLKTGRPQIDDTASDWTSGPKLVMPGPLGAHNWQPMSYSPKTGLVYIPAQEAAALLAANNDAVFDPRTGTWNLGTQPLALPEDPKQLQPVIDSYKGRLLAWDPVAQKAAWSQEYRTPWNGGTLSTAGNLVFQGSADGRFLAYAADSGRKLWEAPANSGVMAGPMSYTVQGEQYVAVLAGWGGAFPLSFGALSLNAKVRPESRVLVYKLGGGASRPPPKNAPVEPPSPPAMSADTAVINHGRDLFNGNCGVCHGLSAISGGVVPDLRYLSAAKHAVFPGIVYGARASRGMPSFAGKLKPDEVNAIHQYLIKRAHDLQDDLKAAQTAAKAP
ncbi:MAG: PQQ-dependent dehydrogenase, methanol/ethanol family [Nevskia sp.]|nr:PQQ-dependent dehydrogenase, methanol/ethanol family [Nevskia sp.]